jgi:protein disulfide-isomerase
VRNQIAILAVILAGCSSPEPTKPAARPEPAKPAASPAPASSGIVIKGSKSDTGASKEPSPEERERIAKLEASAKSSQGKHEGADAVAPSAVKPAAKGRKPGSSEWTSSLETALQRARDENKLVLANFTGSDWCPWCKKLKTEILDKPEFSEWVAQNAVLLELDFPKTTAQSDDLKAQNKKLAEKFGIKGFPTVVFFDPDGNTHGTLLYKEGGPTVWIAGAQPIVDAYKP